MTMQTKPGEPTVLEKLLIGWSRNERAKRGVGAPFEDLYAEAIRLGVTSGPVAFRYRWLELMRMEQRT